MKGKWIHGEHIKKREDLEVGDMVFVHVTDRNGYWQETKVGKVTRIGEKISVNNGGRTKAYSFHSITFKAVPRNR